MTSKPTLVPGDKLKARVRELEKENRWLRKRYQAFLDVLEDIHQEHEKLARAKDELGKTAAIEAKNRALEQDLAQAANQLEIASAKAVETEHEYRQILDSLEDMVLVKGEKSRLLWANRAFLRYYGMSAEELQGIIDAPFSEPDHTAQYVEDDLAVWRSGEPLHIPEEPVTRHDGTVKYFETVKAPIFDNQGRVKMTVGVSRDLTRRREADELRRSREEAEAARRVAEAASRTKSMFLASMSHELRTPLNAVLGYAQVLEQEIGLSDRQRECVEAIQRSGQHLLTLVSDVLDLSRVEAGKMSLVNREFHLPDFFRSVIDACAERARRRRLSLDYRVRGDLPVAIQADETRLRQILFNLITNAIKFTDAGQVTLEVAYKEGTLQCQVTDTGRGIPREQMETIFMPFEQLPREDTAPEGAGLGLAICRELIARMGGELGVDSKPGTGSRFWFQIPVVASAENWTPERPRHVITGYQGPRKKLLVVDDKAENRRALELLLTGVGFDVVEAVDGKEATAMAASEKPELILMDLVMPNVDGFEAIHRIRANPDNANTAIIAVSASVLEQVRTRSREAGYDGFLAKPFDAKQVFDTLSRHLHLTWIYRDVTSRESGTDELVDIGAFVDPMMAHNMAELPQELLLGLHEAAEAGDAKAVLALLDESRVVMGDRDRFITELYGLAKRFQLSEIGNRIAPLILDV